ncbi:HNH endonuclease signature motif containing protein [Bradyrhizobium sp. UFLA01-814]|uniref:HNH endonuclease signature motif containing protein n=1 Tax=Bradyrhizobium sp. UFLA01-814 TaxID=3023480 RepID=UPI00398BAF9B
MTPSECAIQTSADDLPDLVGQIVEPTARAAEISEVPWPAGASESAAYETYIGSNAWKTNPSRLAELRASGYRCRTCNASRDEARLEVHHRTYENFGRELMSDLTTLCAACHKVITSELRSRRYAAHPVVMADYAAETASAPLFDVAYSTGDV